MLTLYGMTDSGNCYKPRLLLAKLGRPFRHVEVSSRDGGTRSPEFLTKNPNAMVPLLEFEDGRTLVSPTPCCCILPKARASCRPTAMSGRRRINGCSSSNTVMSPISLCAGRCFAFRSG